MSRSATERDGFIYCAGAAIAAFLRKVEDCPQCEDELCVAIPPQSFVEMRKYDSVSHLLYPNPNVIEYLENLENYLHRHLRFFVVKRKVVQSILSSLDNVHFISIILGCPEHEDLCQEVLRKIWIQRSIKLY
ncbi:MAG: hypothetical protein AAF135_27305, partial [Bacteroidota bacterium]